ncbi:hypothetical protein A0H81_09346 [Grifola frondosa]|uniref:Uncharacterized protein n=1 Tax=Grifola frondosa TaxID=5627 RepID=A0A1C7M346_GRIFR|nr:hypothetical protein A0H81_09346 [Grifola frondosa]
MDDSLAFSQTLIVEAPTRQGSSVLVSSCEAFLSTVLCSIGRERWCLDDRAWLGLCNPSPQTGHGRALRAHRVYTIPLIR